MVRYVLILFIFISNACGSELKDQIPKLSKNLNFEKTSKNIDLNKLEFKVSKYFKKALEGFYNYGDIRPNFKPYKFGQGKTENKNKTQPKSLLDYNQAAKSVAYIECVGPDDYYKRSAGVIISKETLLMPLSGFESCEEIYVIGYGGIKENPNDDRFYVATTSSIDEQRNFMIVTTSPIKEDIEKITLGNPSKLKKRDSIFMVTHSKERYWDIFEGSYERQLDDFTWYFNKDISYTNNLIISKFGQTPLMQGSIIFNQKMEMIGLSVFEDDKKFDNAISTFDIIDFFEEILEETENNQKKKDKNKKKEQGNEEILNCADSNNSGFKDICYIDDNENGISEAVSVDKNEDGGIDIIFIDGNENEIFETKWISGKNHPDADYDLYFIDEDENETYDVIGHDYDNNQVIDEYEKIS